MRATARRGRNDAAPFDQELFQRELTELRFRHGVLAISAHVMVPLDTGSHHVFRSDTAIDQLHTDMLGIAARHALQVIRR